MKPGLITELLLTRLRVRFFQHLQRQTGRPVQPGHISPKNFAAIRQVHTRWPWSCPGAACICKQLAPSESMAG